MMNRVPDYELLFLDVCVNTAIQLAPNGFYRAFLVAIARTTQLEIELRGLDDVERRLSFNSGIDHEGNVVQYDVFADYIETLNLEVLDESDES